MNSKPKFWLAFKAVAQIREQMIAELEARYYAYHSFYYAFQDRDLVLRSVLANTDDPEAIYDDANFGMSSSRNLFNWVKALLDGSSSQTYLAIVNYFSSIGIELTEAQMEDILGDKSLLKMLVDVMLSNICLTYNYVDNTIDREDFFQTQWATLDVLTNQDLGLHDDSPPIQSFTQLTDFNSIQVYPEFSYFKNYYESATHSPDTEGVDMTKS
mmetsp:Transcript_33877/g.24933  ORF Transcript_33877/g.24933 Transcript_33877/m.24933 type:complete len:213 (-) Transcript_33877:2075-2713(-)